MTTRATFCIANPDGVDLTLSLTMTRAEWMQLRTDINDGGAAAVEFGRKLSHMITKAADPLARDTWTTGYSSGPVAD